MTKRSTNAEDKLKLFDYIVGCFIIAVISYGIYLKWF